MLGGDPYRAPWLKPVKEIEYRGEPPLALLKYVDDLPVEVEAVFLSPFIPGDLKDSALPVLIVAVKVRNRGAKPLDVSLWAMLRSPFGRAVARARGNAVVLRDGGEPGDSPLRDGSMALAAKAGRYMQPY
jgi:Predicted bile acid beta-glucosidase